MSASGPEPALLDARSTVAPPRRPAHLGEGRLWLGLRTGLVAVQVACLTLVGWAGAILTLLPLAIRGGPIGRRIRVGVPRVVRLLEPAPPREEVLPR